MCVRRTVGEWGLGTILSEDHCRFWNLRGSLVYVVSPITLWIVYTNTLEARRLETLRVMTTRFLLSRQTTAEPNKRKSTF